MMIRAIILVFGVCLVSVSCTERLICPAYQSAYIYDKDELRKKFSYFENDSTPKIYSASKTKYLIAEPVSYRTKVRSMQTVKMKPVPVVVPDSIANPGADSVSMEEMARATQSVIDSTFIVDVLKDSVKAPVEDSIYVITKDKELRLLKYNGADSLDYDSILQRWVRQKPQYFIADVRYNLEQDHYMWYLRDQLVLPDVKLAKMGQGEDGGGGGKGVKKKSGGVFKNLFKKKKRDEVDSTQLNTAPKEEFDFIDTTATEDQPVPGEVQPQKQPKKKGGLFKKKNKSDKKAPADQPKEATKKKEEDDGF